MCIEAIIGHRGLLSFTWIYIYIYIYIYICLSAYIII